MKYRIPVVQLKSPSLCSTIPPTEIGIPKYKLNAHLRAIKAAFQSPNGLMKLSRPGIEINFNAFAFCYCLGSPSLPPYLPPTSYFDIEV